MNPSRRLTRASKPTGNDRPHLPPDRNADAGLSLAAFVAYTAWIMRAVWVNAFNAEKETYGHIARALNVAWAINSVLVSGFLLLGRMGAVQLSI